MLRDVARNGASSNCIPLHGGAAVPSFDQVLDEFLASVVKESVGGTYAAESEEEAERDCFISVI